MLFQTTTERQQRTLCSNDQYKMKIKNAAKSTNYKKKRLEEDIFPYINRTHHYHHNRFTALFPGPPGEPVPEENF